MNSELKIKQFLANLAEAFPGSAKTSTLQSYYTVLKDDLGDVDLSGLYKTLTRDHRFFPTIRDILDIIEPKEETPREKAIEFVDIMISSLYARGNINQLVGESNYSFWLKHTGADRFAISRNAVEPRVMRGAWIDAFERIFAAQTTVSAVKSLYDMERVVQLPPRSTPEGEGA